MSQNESTLLRQFVQTGDAEAFSEITRRYAGLVYGTCLRVTGEAEHARDATQETFYQLLLSAGKVTGSLGGWLHQVATRRAVDLVRRYAVMIALGLGCPALIAGSNSALAGAAGTNQVKAPNAGREQALKLLDQYAATRSQLNSFIFKDQGSVVWDAHYTPDMNQKASGHRTIYHSEEFRFDGARYKLYQKLWGPMPNDTFLESNPRCNFLLWDGTNAWDYMSDPTAGPGTPRPRAHRYLLRTGGGTPLDRYNGVLGMACKVYFLLGYFPIGKTRIDLNFRQASSVSVRGQTELVGGSPCFVLDAVTKSGRGSIWLDPQHGYLIAKAEYHVRAGDFYNNHIQKAGTVMDFKLYDVQFKKVNDTWVTVTGTEESNKTWLPDGYEHYKERYAISEIILKPDFSMMPNAFGLDDVQEGAAVRVGDKKNFVWRNGKIQAGP